MDCNVIFEYNNVDKPYLLVRIYNDGELINRGLVNLESVPLADGLPEKEESFVASINNLLNAKNVSRNKVLFLVNCDQLCKVTLRLPKLNDRKIRKLYENELANKISNIDSYAHTTYESENDKEKIYYEYLLDKKYIDYFRRVGQQLGFETVDFNIFSDYLFSTIKANFNEDVYAYFYEENGIVSMLTVINNCLCSFKSFVNTEANFNLYLSSIIDNHKNGLEKINIENVHSNKEIEYLKKL